MDRHGAQRISAILGLVMLTISGLAAWLVTEALLRGPVRCEAQRIAGADDDPMAIDEALGLESGAETVLESDTEKAPGGEPAGSSALLLVGDKTFA